MRGNELRSKQADDPINPNSQPSYRPYKFAAHETLGYEDPTARSSRLKAAQVTTRRARPRQSSTKHLQALLFDRKLKSVGATRENCKVVCECRAVKRR